MLNQRFLQMRNLDRTGELDSLCEARRRLRTIAVSQQINANLTHLKIQNYFEAILSISFNHVLFGSTCKPLSAHSRALFGLFCVILFSAANP